VLNLRITVAKHQLGVLSWRNHVTPVLSSRCASATATGEAF